METQKTRQQPFGVVQQDDEEQWGNSKDGVGVVHHLEAVSQSVVKNDRDGHE